MKQKNMGKKVKPKSKCNKCGKEHQSKSLVMFKGKFLCYNCRINTKQSRALRELPINKDEKKLLEKTYEIRPAGTKNLSGVTWFNRKLIGKKFKLQIIEEEDDKR